MEFTTSEVPGGPDSCSSMQPQGLGDDNSSLIDLNLETFGFGSISDAWELSNSVLGPYVPIDYFGVAPSSFRPRSVIPHSIGGLQSQMNIAAWSYELSFEIDSHLKSYLFWGITNGFRIVDMIVMLYLRYATITSRF